MVIVATAKIAMVATIARIIPAGHLDLPHHLALAAGTVPATRSSGVVTAVATTA
ncbi:MAG: hypothetical protein ACKO2P_04010 [Planctomycetota bacterium]